MLTVCCKCFHIFSVGRGRRFVSRIFIAAHVVITGGEHVKGQHQWEYDCFGCFVVFHDDPPCFKSTNTVSGYSNPWFIKGDSANGAAFPHNNTTVPGCYSEGTTANDLVAIYYMYYSGTWILTGVTGTAVVKTKQANSLGLYDMSGNVREWCFTGWELARERRGGSLIDYADKIQVGLHEAISPFTEFGDMCFIFAKTQ